MKPAQLLRKRTASSPGMGSRSRALALLLAVLAGACGDAPEAGTVATVDGWVLTESQLAELLVLAQPFPLDPGAVEELARHWIGVAAFATRASRGDDLASAEAVAASTWLEEREALLAAERESRLGLTPIPDPAATFQAAELRLVAHVFRRVGPETSTAERDLQRRTAERILSGLVAGGSWDDAVAESQDVDTRDVSGLLGLVGRGELPPALDRVALRLEPGQISSVVTSEEGFHILYRPRFRDVEGLFARRLRERRLAEADAASARGLLARRGLTMLPDATVKTIRLAVDPLTGLSSEGVLATWQGGALTEAVVARYVAGLPSSARGEMADADDSAVRGFLRDIALRELRVQDAEAAGVTLSEEARLGFAEQHAREVDLWMSTLGFGEGGAVDRGTLGRYMEDVASRQTETRSLSPLFEAWLLEGVGWSLQPAGIYGAIAGARAMLTGIG